MLKLGTAWGNADVGSRSGLLSRLRYRVHQLVSTVSCMRFVSRGFPLDPVAVLPGKVANGLRSTISARFEAKYALMKFWWVNSSSVFSWLYGSISPSRTLRAAV